MSNQACTCRNWHIVHGLVHQPCMVSLHAARLHRMVHGCDGCMAGSATAPWLLHVVEWRAHHPESTSRYPGPLDGCSEVKVRRLAQC
eukprot:COSAG01_NODE_1182_length_11347_cov_7.504356_11_plen_87_part_00